MMRLLFIFLLPTYILASQILSYNIYNRTERVDVMLTFDTPFEGVIKKSTKNSKIIIKLEGTTIESSKVKHINSKFLKSITITPMQKYTQIVATVGQKTRLLASKTADGYGLRLRFTQKKLLTKEQNPITNMQTPQNTQLSTLPTKKGNDIPTRYYIVITILFILVIVLMFVKKKILKDKPVQPSKNSWLFKETPKSSSKTENLNNPNNDEISIRFQKSIDTQNSVVMLDFKNNSYLIMVGNGNFLLDKFTDDKPRTQTDFETMLQERHEELDDFLQLGQQQEYKKREEIVEQKDPIDIYKEKVAMNHYSEYSK